MVKIVNKGLKLKLIPDSEMSSVLNQNINNSRFIWNKLLERYNNYRQLFKSHDYPLNPSIKNFNVMLNMLKTEYPFLREGESTSQQQVFRDLNKAFQGFFNECKGYPNFKSKKNKKQSFRIQKNGNNIRVTKRKIRLAKIGFINYQTSPKYRKLLKNSKINNVTVKKENGIYYATVNIECEVEEFDKTGKRIGIDIGIKTLATLSDFEEISNPDLSKTKQMIKKYQKKLSRQKYMSKNYQKTLKHLHKWINHQNNIKNNAYHQISKKLVEKYDIIAMETLNIKGWFQNNKWSPKLQKTKPYNLINKIQYKSDWYGKTFIQINRFFPSSKQCNHCEYKYADLTLNMREWTCPQCGNHNHRDYNASKNILKEGLRILHENPSLNP